MTRGWDIERNHAYASRVARRQQTDTKKIQLPKAVNIVN